jgi:hypothetical protein
LFAATLRPPTGSASSREALVRISDTFGWPRPLPDWVGLAIRLLDNDGEPDLLLVSSAPEPEMWCQLRPNRDVLACTFSSAVRYPLEGVEQVVGAVPVENRSATLAELIAGSEPCPLRYRLQVAERPGSWHSLGDLELTERVADDPKLRFHPPATGPRFLAPLRRTVYRWAQPEAAR